ncbi:pseudouridine synthase [Sphingobacterium chuzhouense]|uniref:Pseudouridine synthase n=1 Tax=Sphingobacterium chuzhouense TaxID=1742264 RepID=A0ABR7XVN9_9SPHI|nr:pseudouridine synthase [Sphingobacterium chuzhouense]MBD1423111.1 rRNA pseudouridine synthase [Sphingobacterium chuzhouense]
MPFNNKRNSRDDNSKKSRSNSENFRSKNGRSQRSSSTNDFRKPRFEEEDNKKSHPFAKFEKKNRKDDSDRSFNKFDKLVKRNTERSFQKDEKGAYNGPKKFDRPGKRSFNRFDDGNKNRNENRDRDKYKNKDTSRTSYPRKKIATAEPKDDGLIRLNRYISNAGVCSRRKADELIESGVVTVNGEVVTELGTKVDPAKDEIRYNGERLKREKMVYVLLNKPKDFITTTDDPQERKTVMQLVAKASKERIYPVGRLDRNTTGLLLLTNDGALAEKLSHPRNNISKIYHIELSKNLTQGDFNKIQFGLELEDGFIKPDDISYVQGGGKNEIGIQIHSGKNRIVRRIFESLGYEVLKLDRVVYANLTKKDLPRGRWRYLEEKELIQLKHFIK